MLDKALPASTRFSMKPRSDVASGKEFSILAVRALELLPPRLWTKRSFIPSKNADNGGNVAIAPNGGGNAIIRDPTGTVSNQLFEAVSRASIVNVTLVQQGDVVQHNHAPQAPTATPVPRPEIPTGGVFQ
jgi:hypothetical protein